MVTKKALTIYQGATFEVLITHLDYDGSDVPASDVSAVRMQARETVDSSTTLFDLSASGGEINVVDGLITITMSHTATAALDFDSGVYDVEVTYTDGKVGRILMGRVVLSKEVTR